MKIGKYPVKFSYKIPRLIADVFTLGLSVLIASATLSFFSDYEAQLDLMRIGQDNVETIIQNYDPSIAWRKWIALVFPVLALAVIAAYLVLTIKSHSFKNWEVTKRNAQACYDEYAFGVSLCKIPVLIIIFDLMCVAHDKLLPFPKYGFSWFSWSIILYALIIAIIIRYTVHRITGITAKKESTHTDAVRVKAVAVVKSSPENASDNAEKTNDKKEDI